MLAVDGGPEGGLVGERAEGVARPIVHWHPRGLVCVSVRVAVGRGLWEGGGGEAVAARDSEWDSKREREEGIIMAMEE